MYTLGKKLRFSLFGRSHAPCVGCILEGVPQGTVVDMDSMAADMALRKPSSGIGTDRKEADRVDVICGIVDGKANGNPIILEIANGDVDDSKYLPF